MNFEASVGHAPHARQEASPTNNTDARCACGAALDGYDARAETPTCTQCAALCTDGGDPTDSIRDRLRKIDQHTRALLVDIHNPSGTAIEDVDAETRAEAADHVRQLRAEASHVGLALIGPTATMHYSPFAQGDGPIVVGDALATSYDGPEPGAYEQGDDADGLDRDDERDRSPDEDPDRTDDTVTDERGGDDG